MDNLWRKARAMLSGDTVCPVCRGRTSTRIKFFREYADGTRVNEPGCEWQDREPDACPACTPPGTITRVVVVYPAEIDGGESTGYDQE